MVRVINSNGGALNSTIRGTRLLYGKRLWLLDESDIKTNIEKLNPKYQITGVTISYPQSLLISAQALFPTAYVKISEGFLLLSKEGRILEKTREQKDMKYPVITYYQSIPYYQYGIGSYLENKDILDAMYFKYFVELSKEKVNSIDIAGYHVLRLYTKEHEYIFSSDRERDMQVYLFKKALFEFQISGTVFKTLDFRYEKPVVTF